tara:strand:- start:41 stop:199 length:159 start_codon:yes stop_codon:yes gene_type:complete
MPIHNYLFELARKEREAEEKAIELLRRRGYVISCKTKTYVAIKEKAVNETDR